MVKKKFLKFKSEFQKNKETENNSKDVVLLKFTFEYKSDIYEANSQIRKRKNGDVDISVGYYGDEFPCIILNYIQKKRIFKIDRIRAQSFGGYSADDRMLCIRNVDTKTFLPEKGSLDILIMLSLAIFDWIYSNNFIGNLKFRPNVLIRDMAMKDEYPLSWLKYFKSYETTYSKYGFRIRGMEPPVSLCDDSDYYDLPNPSFSFEHYIKKEIPDILSQKLIGGSSPLIGKNTYDMLFMPYLKHLNDTLKRKKIKTIQVEKNTTVKSFLMDVFETKRQKEYKDILCFLDSMIVFDIRNYWFLDYDYYLGIKEKVIIKSVIDF